MVNLIYVWCIERVDPDRLAEWQSDLVDLLPWQDSTTEAAATIESESFYAMQQAGR